MINTLGRAATLLTVAFAFAAPAFSQAPTDAQRNAIRSECRSDYEAHCSSVPPGGEASLQCLQKNMSSLSGGCQTAVRAVEAPAAPKKEAAPVAPKTESAPAAAASPAAAPKAAASTATKQPTSAQISAIRSACRSDYPKVCGGVPTGGAPALQCLEKNKARLSAGCGKAGAAASGGAAPAAAAAPGAAPAGAPPGVVAPPMRPRGGPFVMPSACGRGIGTQRASRALRACRARRGN